MEPTVDHTYLYISLLANLRLEPRTFNPIKLWARRQDENDLIQKIIDEAERNRIK